MSSQVSSMGTDSAMQTALTAQLFQISTSSAMRTVEKSQRNADVTVVAMQRLVNELKQEICALTSTIRASQSQREQEKSALEIEIASVKQAVEECRSGIAKIKERVLQTSTKAEVEACRADMEKMKLEMAQMKQVSAIQQAACMQAMFGIAGSCDDKFGKVAESLGVVLNFAKDHLLKVVEMHGSLNEHCISAQHGIGEALREVLDAIRSLQIVVEVLYNKGLANSSFTLEELLKLKTAFKPAVNTLGE